MAATGGGGDWYFGGALGVSAGFAGAGGVSAFPNDAPVAAAASPLPKLNPLPEEAAEAAGAPPNESGGVAVLPAPPKPNPMPVAPELEGTVCPAADATGALNGVEVANPPAAGGAPKLGAGNPALGMGVAGGGFEASAGAKIVLDAAGGLILPGLIPCAERPSAGFVS